MVCFGACAEDRALLGSNPSADTGLKAGGEFVIHGSRTFLIDSLEFACFVHNLL